MHQNHFRILVGIDLGRWLHHACVLDASGELLQYRRFAHSSEGLSKTVEELLNLAQQRPELIAVAIETPHGAVVETLLQRGIAVFAINPKQVDRFRDRYAVSSVKDDPRDAFVLADVLRTDGHRFPRLHLPPPEIVALRELLSARNQLIKHHVALSSQIRELLVRCWPHLLTLAPRNRALDSFFCELLELFFHADRTVSLQSQSFQTLLKKHHIRRVKLEQIIDILQKPSLPVAPGTAAATSIHIKLLVQQLLLVWRQRRDSDQYLERWFKQNQHTSEPKEPTDAAILASLPGVGSFVLASVLSHAHDAIHLRNLNALRSLGGIAPVTRQSGQRRHVLMRRARSQPLNYALHHWAHMAVLRDPHFELHYRRLRARGHTHARALRGLMDRILTIAIAMLRDRTFYNPSRRKNERDNKNTTEKVFT
jgi:transposase